jgi:hypothetical protein
MDDAAFCVRYQYEFARTCKAHEAEQVSSRSFNSGIPTMTMLENPSHKP